MAWLTMETTDPPTPEQCAVSSPSLRVRGASNIRAHRQKRMLQATEDLTLAVTHCEPFGLEMPSMVSRRRRQLELADRGEDLTEDLVGR